MRRARVARTMSALVAVSLLSVGVGARGASALPAIANAPPAFRVYDVDRREREMRRLIGQLAGTSTLSHAQADAALGRLDDIARRERASRAHNGGRLGPNAIRTVDAELNALSRRLGVRTARR